MNIVPMTSTVSGLGTSFTQNFPGYSITVLSFVASDQPVAVDRGVRTNEEIRQR